MRKLTSVLLIMIMVLCMGATAFADTTSIKIEGDAADYNAYQLLYLNIIHKDGECAGPHTSECYDYYYTVNNKYLTILQNEVFGNTVEGTFESASKVTQDHILAYLSNLSGDNVDGTYGTLRPAADRIYRAIKSTTPAITPEKELQSGSNTGVTVDQGYWLIADVTNVTGVNDANSLVMVNTKGQDTLTITPKTALPQLEKKVKDINESTDDAIADNAWADSADHDKGNTVPFKLTATVPANVSNYGTYTMIFHDTMENGLTLDSTSVKVYKYETKTAADTDIALTSVTPLFEASEGNYTTADVTYAPAADNHAFELTLTNVLTGEDAATGNNAFVIYYEAELNENAVMGSAGNSNTAYLEFSNDPYSTSTGTTPNDKVKVFTYQLKINKVDDKNQPLPGAGFTLYKKNKAGTYDAVGSEVKGDGMTTFIWERLDDGDYKLVETTVPTDYNKMEDKMFTITAEHDEVADEPSLVSLTSTLGTVDGGIITENVINQNGTVLPSTGAKGTMMLIGGGSVLIVLAAVFMITRKKMSIYED